MSALGFRLRFECSCGHLGRRAVVRLALIWHPRQRRMRKIETKGRISLTTLTKIKTDSESFTHQIDEIERLNLVHDNLGTLVEILRSLYRI
jgi:hypothetical protein